MVIYQGFRAGLIINRAKVHRDAVASFFVLDFKIRMWAAVARIFYA